MKIKITKILGFMLAVVIAVPAFTNAQMMYSNTQNSSVTFASSTQIAQEEAQGKAIYDQLQAKQTTCANLTDDNFDVLGDYFMGQMMGSSHAAMDQLMTQRIGEQNNTLMHITLGKRFSGCDASAVFPSQGASFLPMMGIGGTGMMGGWSNYSSSNQPYGFNSMMGNYYGYGMMGGNYGGFGWIFMILWWALIIVGIVMLVQWIIHRSKRGDRNALEILKERYAKGDINKQEFEEKKKDLV